MSDDPHTDMNGDLFTYDAETLRQVVHDLGQRVKHLDCLYGMSRLIETPGLSLEEILQGTVKLLPAAWQYPENTCARIVFEGQEFNTETFCRSHWVQAADLIVSGERSGAVEVYYREARPERDEGPFLGAERNLLDAIAERLGRVVERVRAEEALRERERQLFLIADNIPASVVHVDEDKRYRFVNHRHVELLGRSREEIIGKPFREILGEEIYASIQDKVERVLSGRRVSFESVLPRPSGGELWFDMSYVPDIDERGTVRGYIVLANDITARVRAEEALRRAHDELEQRVQERTAELTQANARLRAESAERERAEEAYRTLVEHSLQGLLILQRGRIAFANPGIADLSGYSRQELLSLSPDGVQALLHLEDRERVWRNLQQRLVGEPVPPRYELRFVRADGQVRWVEVLASRVDYRDEPAVQLACLDVTERVQAEGALRRYAERLEIMREIDRDILAARSPEAIARVALTNVRRLIPCQRADVLLHDPQANEMLILAVDADAETQAVEGAHARYDPAWDEIAEVQQGKVVVLDAPRLRQVSSLLYDEGMRLFAAIPLYSQGQLLGLLNLMWTDPGGFTREDRQVARQVADQLAIAIRQARLHEQVQRHAQELEQRVADRTRELATFFDLARLTGRGRELLHALEPAVTRIWDVAHCQALCLHLLAEDGGTLELVTQRDLPDDARRELGLVTVEGAFARRVSRPGAPIATSDLAGSSLLPRPLRVAGYRTYLGVQLRVGEQPQGWLSYYRASAQGFTLDETALLVALAEQIGVIVENHRLRRRIEEVAALEERGRLARDLHDSVTQSLYGLTLLARSAREAAGDGDARRLATSLEGLEGDALQALREMRLLLYEMRPLALEEEGLVGALDLRLNTVERRTGMRATLQVQGALELERAVQVELYYLAIEALNNVLKHAGAGEVTVRLEAQGAQVWLEIADDGCGFDPGQASGGMGLADMRERAERLGGRLEVSSAPGAGTRIVALIDTGLRIGRGSRDE